MTDNLIKSSSNPDSMSEQDDSQLRGSLMHIILWHRWTILFTTIGCLIIAFIYISKATPIYTSESRLYVEQSGPKIINEYEGIMTRSNNYLYTQGELMKSTPIITAVIDNSDIRNFKSFNNIDNLLGYLKSSLNISVGRADDIITVSFESPYPAEAAQLVNEVVNAYVDYHSIRKRSTVSEVLRILQNEKSKRDEELSQKFGELLEFTRENGVVSFDNNNGNIVLGRLTRLSEALTQAQLASMNAKADYEAAKSMANEPEKIRQFAGASADTGIIVFDTERETQLRGELRTAETDLENTRLHCTDDHPAIQAIKAKIQRINDELFDQSKQFADAYIEVRYLRWQATKQREEELTASVEIQHQMAQELGIKAAEYTVLQSELSRAERVCEILDDRIKELNVTEDTGALNITILEVARPADSPSKPQKAKVMSTALAIGIMFGIGLAIFRDWMDYRLRSAEEISAMLGFPVLGEVPAMSEGQLIVNTRFHQICLNLKSLISDKFQTSQPKAFSATPKSKIRLRKQSIMARAKSYRAMRAVDGHKTQSSIIRQSSPKKRRPTSVIQTISERGQVVRLRPKSVIAEAYRTIRTSIFFGIPEGGAKTILITSPTPGDGKTTLASNLAIAMAQAGQKTLLLDADLRKPTQYKIFEMENKYGLANVMVGEIGLEKAIISSPVTGLDLLLSGPSVPNPSEILNSQAFARILNNISERYDRVIIDSTPVLPVADSQVIAARCDAVVLVIRVEKSTKRVVKHACNNLIGVGGHILGAVVNDVARRNGRYGYYGRYQRGYGYGEYGYGSYYGEDNEESYEIKNKHKENVYV